MTEAAAGLSEHPIPVHAAGEAIGAVLEQMGPGCDLATVFVTGNHSGALDDVARTVAQLLRPRVLLGAAAAGVVGGRREVAEQPGIAVFAARCGGGTPVRLRAARMETGWSVTGLPATATDGSRHLLLYADPHTFPADALLSHLGRDAPGLQVVGGLLSGAQGAGGARLVVDGELHTTGAVGLLLAEDADVSAVVSQGCRPVGDPFVVTEADGRHLLALGGRPAVDRVRELLEALGPEERLLATTGLQVGLVLDESLASFEAGDFLVRPVLAVDTGTGAVSLGEEVEVGRTVQFQLRDAAAADADLRRTLAGVRADGALVATGVRRSRHVTGDVDRDAETLVEALGTRAVAGISAVGEIGPVAGRSHVHSAGVAAALFGARPT